MNISEAIEDLETLKEYFEQNSKAYPVCLEYAIKKLKECCSDEEMTTDCGWR